MINSFLLSFSLYSCGAQWTPTDKNWVGDTAGADSGADPPEETDTTTGGVPPEDTGGMPGDYDGDGWSLQAGDCNDIDPSIHPGAQETCDGADNNCDHNVDEGMTDTDGDGSCDEIDTCDGTTTHTVEVQVDPGSGECSDGNGLTRSTPFSWGTDSGCTDRWYIACNTIDGSATIVATIGVFRGDNCAHARATNETWPATPDTCGWLSVE
jgi:hypothetical protein